MEQNVEKFAEITKSILESSGFICPKSIAKKDAGLLYKAFARINRVSGSVPECLMAWTALERAGFEAPAITPLGVLKEVARYAEV